MAQKAKPISKEEYTTNKVLSVFSICMLGVLVLMILQRLINYTNTWQIGYGVQKALLVVGALGVLLGLWLMAKERSGKRNSKNRILTGRNIIIISAILCLTMAAVGMMGDGPIKVMYLVLPALAVYYLIYYSYSTEFFWISVDCGVAAGLIWLVRRALNSSNYTYFSYLALACAAVLCIVQLIVVLRVRKQDGSITVMGRKRKVPFSRNAYRMLLITPVVMALTVAAAAIIGLTVNTICLGVAGAYLFVTIVYYTVKLI